MKFLEPEHLKKCPISQSAFSRLFLIPLLGVASCRSMLRQNVLQLKSCLPNALYLFGFHPLGRQCPKPSALCLQWFRAWIAFLPELPVPCQSGVMGSGIKPFKIRRSYPILRRGHPENATKESSVLGLFMSRVGVLFYFYILTSYHSKGLVLPPCNSSDSISGEQHTLLLSHSLQAKDLSQSEREGLIQTIRFMLRVFLRLPSSITLTSGSLY
jgi:hypothetical protein